MIRTISQSERLDILLALALVFRQTEEIADQTAAQLAEKTLASVNPPDWETLRNRAALFDSQPPPRQQLWQSFWLDKIRRRGHSVRLDEQIHPAQVVEILQREPRSIQLLILRNLAPAISREIAAGLGIEDFAQDGAAATPTAEIVALIRREFLSSFVTLEDVYEPAELDKLSIAELARFIQLLGIRETAIACRAINSKETLAAFLNRFSEDNTREIVYYITEMEKVKPFWVIQAEKLLRDNWNTALAPDELLQVLGLRLLATAMLERGETARLYTRQKLAPRAAQTLLENIAEIERARTSASKEDLATLNARQNVVERFAAGFAQSNKLEN